ncbi:hypothetical protein AB0P15_28180, partial [Streptomyces sp. NPDC087917]|uniref:hypothetical protein n=1 Tax=Streptomyces sp. NPDC087917 TaxID=3155060 RepID=UPI00343DFE57
MGLRPLRLVHTRLFSEAGGAGTRDDAHLMQDLLWAHAGPEHAVEHIRVRAAPHGIELVLFVRAETEAIATARARSLLSGAVTP